MNSSIERYPGAFKLSQETLSRCRCSYYPIDIEHVILSCVNKNIIIISETDYKRFRSETNETRPYISIKDGRTYYDPNRDLYLIVYNDSKNATRIRFTMAHEFAHIMLGHLSSVQTEIDRGGLPDSVYLPLEGEANTFAGNFLAPPVIIAEVLGDKPFNIKTVASTFQISIQAVKDYRKEDFFYWKTLTPSPDELHVLKNYQIRLCTFLCTTCGSIFTIPEAKNCPVCGNVVTQSTTGDEEIVGKTYSSIELNAYWQAAECPICGNEDHLNDAKFCMVCSKPIVNYCTLAFDEDDDSYAPQCSHTEPLPGGARYCPYCGSETTFLRNNLLSKWDYTPELPPWYDGEDADELLPF